jgi:hypothetical protein
LLVGPNVISGPWRTKEAAADVTVEAKSWSGVRKGSSTKAHRWLLGTEKSKGMNSPQKIAEGTQACRHLHFRFMNSRSIRE